MHMRRSDCTASLIKTNIVDLIVNIYSVFYTWFNLEFFIKILLASLKFGLAEFVLIK